MAMPSATRVFVNQLNHKVIFTRLHIIKSEPNISRREIEATLLYFPNRSFTIYFFYNLDDRTSNRSILVIRVFARNSFVFLQNRDVNFSSFRDLKFNKRVAATGMFTLHTRVIIFSVDVTDLNMREVLLKVFPAHEESAIICVCPVAFSLKISSPLI